jgi:hypothetical protein
MLFRFFILALGIVLAADAAQPASGRLAVERGEFRLILDDGRVLAGDALTGLRIVIESDAEPIFLRIDAVAEDMTASGKPLVLYRILVEDAGGQAVHEACLPDVRGRRLGLPLLKEAGITITCTGGAEGKCILMGYRPWDDDPAVPMHDLHAACIHMVRADYGGDDHATTRDGTIIDVYDRFGIQKPEAGDPMPFEAAWSRNGALCVAHPRIAENVSLDELAQRYPRLRDRLGAEACTEEALRHHPDALLFNRSALTVR